MKKVPKSDKKGFPARKAVKKHSKKQREKNIEQEYRTVFSPNPLSYQGSYIDGDSLEQPSALRYVPSTTTPAAETTISPRMRRDAELE
jgi:hypothetical protein